MSQEVAAAAASGRKMEKEQVRRLTLAAMLTAIVVVLALLGTAIRFGTFNVNLALVPIVIGAAMLGVWYGAWFGFVNALVILISGDAAPFLMVSVFGTIVTVVAKGVLAGLASGLVYRAVARHNQYAAVILAALVCPLVNTGVFLIGCLIFFWKTIGEWAAASGAGSTFAYAIVGLVGVNFLIEVAINIILAPAIARILGFSQDKDVALSVYGCVMVVLGSVALLAAMILLRNAYLGKVVGITRPGLRYAMMALFSNLIQVGGTVLLVMGQTRKNTRNAVLAAQQKGKKSK